MGTLTGQALMIHRRSEVARLTLRGFSQSEILQQLTERGCVNPADDSPWAESTIQADIRALTQAWREMAQADMADHKARIFAEIQYVKRNAWERDDLQTVLHALKQERELLGVDECMSMNVTIQAANSLDEKLEQLAGKMGQPPAESQPASTAEALLSGTPHIVTQPAAPVHKVVGNKPPGAA